MIAFLRRLNLLSLPMIALALLYCAIFALLECSPVRAIWPLFATGLDAIAFASLLPLYWLLGDKFADAGGGRGILAMLTVVVAATIAAIAGYPAHLILPFAIAGIALSLGLTIALALIGAVIATGLSTLFLADGVDTLLAAADRVDRAG